MNRIEEQALIEAYVREHGVTRGPTEWAEALPQESLAMRRARRRRTTRQRAATSRAKQAVSNRIKENGHDASR